MLNSGMYGGFIPIKELLMMGCAALEHASIPVLSYARLLLLLHAMRPCTSVLFPFPLMCNSMHGMCCCLEQYRRLA